VCRACVHHTTRPAAPRPARMAPQSRRAAAAGAAAAALLLLLACAAAPASAARAARGTARPRGAPTLRAEQDRVTALPGAPGPLKFGMFAG
jgi:hypothetical protein